MNSFEISILGFLFFICIYTIVDRICRCIEQVTLVRNVDLPDKNTDKKLKEDLV